MSSTHKTLKCFDIFGPVGRNLVAMPTVCLLAMDHLDPMPDIAKILKKMARHGCRFFMSWGAAADNLHDVLDALIEEEGIEFLDIVTTSHAGESAEDVAWFMVNAAIPGELELQCCVGYTDSVVGIHGLLEAIHSAVMQWSN